MWVTSNCLSQYACVLAAIRPRAHSYDAFDVFVAGDDDAVCSNDADSHYLTSDGAYVIVWIVRRAMMSAQANGVFAVPAYA